MLFKYGNCTRLLKIKKKLNFFFFFFFFYKKVGKNSSNVVGVFNKTIIPRVRVGDEMVDSQRGTYNC